MSETATAPAQAPAAAPATPAAAPAAAAPAAAPVAPAPPSLIHDDATAGAPAAPAAAPAPAASDDPFAPLLAKVPEKYHVKQGDKVDAVASLTKALESRAHLEQRLGSGAVPPKSAAEYAFTPPEEFKDFQFKEERLTPFREGFHKLGGTQEQYDFVMKSYLSSASDLMGDVAKFSADEARAELQKVWTTPAAMDAGIQNAKRVISTLPPDLAEATREFGTHPAFLRALAHVGAQMREDRPPADAGLATAGQTVEQLMASKAYMDPKHPEHKAVSAQVAAHFAKAHGDQPL